MTKPTKLLTELEGPSRLPEDLRGAAIERPSAVAEAVGKARVEIGASLNAAAVVAAYTRKDDDIEIACLVRALSDGVREVWGGDTRQAEAMLYGQAHALQAIFMTLARKASRQSTHQQTEGYLRMALKAQNQCRMTLETLATIKNPPVVFARQANINNCGQQQVNVGVATAGPHAPAVNSKTLKSKLLKGRDEQRLDTGATGAPSGADPDVETVASVHRTAHRRR